MEEHENRKTESREEKNNEKMCVCSERSRRKKKLMLLLFESHLFCIIRVRKSAETMEHSRQFRKLVLYVCVCVLLDFWLGQIISSRRQSNKSTIATTKIRRKLTINVLFREKRNAFASNVNLLSEACESGFDCMKSGSKQCASKKTQMHTYNKNGQFETEPAIAKRMESRTVVTL